MNSFTILRNDNRPYEKDLAAVVADYTENGIRLQIVNSWRPVDANVRSLPAITAENILILNVNHPSAYGHLYTDVLPELLTIEETYKEHDCVVTVLTPLMKEVIDFFNLKFSFKLRFVTPSENEKLLRFNTLKQEVFDTTNHVDKAKKVKALKAAFHSAVPIINRNKHVLLYCSRNDAKAAKHGRRLEQNTEDEIINILKQYAIENNLEFVLLTGTEADGTKVSISKQYELFSNAKLVVGPHGGVFSNLIFLDPKKNPKVIEFTPAKGKMFDKLFDGAISNFAEYHRIYYNLPGGEPTTGFWREYERFLDTPATIDLSEFKPILNRQKCTT